MFQKIAYTKYPPSKNILIWDGDCGFCKFWKTRWQLKTKDKIQFATYQEFSENFSDIPLKEFKKASRLIETDGRIYSGPDSAYRSIWHSGTTIWHELYHSTKWFQYLSDHGYNHIAKNRSFYFKLTKSMFGNDPLRLKPYWLLYLILLVLIFAIL